MQPTRAPWQEEGAARLAHPIARQAPPATTSFTAAPWASTVQPPVHTGVLGSHLSQKLDFNSTQLLDPSPKMPELECLSTSQRSPAVKRINSMADLQRFLNSDSLSSYIAFVLSLSEAVRGKKATDLCQLSEPVKRIQDVLSRLSAWVDEIPPAQQSLRYGNPAYKTWHARMVDNALPLLKTILPDTMHEIAQEIAPYFLESFGNATRIDYGTGHETNFCALLYCLARLGILQEQDRQALVLKVFSQYIDLMRKIQTTYWLEPAGSHGVWGLDDYQFLPFIWGASQLIAHPMIKPKTIHNQDVLDTYHHEYMYLSCIKFVKQVKKGPLSETSPMICDVSGVPTWAKVAGGMIKMYQAEVLSKLPIMQHFMFCSLLPFPEEAGSIDVTEGPIPADGAQGDAMIQ